MLMFFIAMLSAGAVPGQAHALSVGLGDKTLHLLAYGLLSVLCFHSFKASLRARSLLTLTMIAVLGLLDEWIQSYLPYRNASFIDWCFDMTAAVTVIIVVNRYGAGVTRTT